MRKISLALFVFLLSFTVFAQENEIPAPPKVASTAFYAELGGPGILFSANIDQRFKKNSHLGWGGRAGLGFVSGYFEDYPVGNPNVYYEQRSVVTIPVQVNYIFGKGTTPHTFEVGAGLTVTGRRVDIFGSYNDATQVYGTASFMYRRQPADGGFSWRIGFTPVIAAGYIQPSGGVSVGYNF